MNLTKKLCNLLIGVFKVMFKVYYNYHNCFINVNFWWKLNGVG